MGETDKGQSVEEIVHLLEKGEKVVIRIDQFPRFLAEAELKRIPLFIESHVIHYGQVILLAPFGAEINSDEGGNIIL